MKKFKVQLIRVVFTCREEAECSEAFVLLNHCATGSLREGGLLSSVCKFSATQQLRLGELGAA